MGAVTPLGIGVTALWDGLLAGASNVVDLSARGEDWANLPVPVASVAPELGPDVIDPIRARRLDRSQALAVVAAAEAWAHAGAPEVERDRLAVVIGAGIGGLQTLLDQDDVLENSGARRVSPRTVPMLMANAAAAQISIEYGAGAGVFTPVSACAAGAEAVAMGMRLIDGDEADVVIVGGAEAPIMPLTLAAFARAQTLAKPSRALDQLSRPFDLHRSGFVLGEGAGVLILESERHAAARRAPTIARIAGFGISSDAHHMTAPDPTGTGQVRAMTTAVRRAGLKAGDVDHINCHATGTAVGDRSEALAIRTVFGEQVPVTAPKASIGHLVGGAGAVEAIITALTIDTGIIPPTKNLDDADPELMLDVVTTEKPGPVSAALTNSFGFGGHNAALLLSAP
ncbi:beta-ketoacyl-[acyl-carrier-protein] synthase family protein [Georgenia yuyongxinii]|uniref:Beta-ketoacyl-[acyl-carrier-protein] synthase family protein n=2 Tax=Georgenia yuyongxinii TaxID=2589797 RepID=A0A5B8C3U4_9MICO|nr:beta-ketoacyl-[acyl-carrier-protein] synthase family protein [Georgenia yuyongxinii]